MHHTQCCPTSHRSRPMSPGAMRVRHQVALEFSDGVWYLGLPGSKGRPITARPTSGRTCCELGPSQRAGWAPDAQTEVECGRSPPWPFGRILPPRASVPPVFRIPCFRIEHTAHSGTDAVAPVHDASLARGSCQRQRCRRFRRTRATENHHRQRGWRLVKMDGRNHRK
jgi:hypothetical protein